MSILKKMSAEKVKGSVLTKTKVMSSKITFATLELKAAGTNCCSSQLNFLY